jgi:hypothetical protein
MLIGIRLEQRRKAAVAVGILHLEKPIATDEADYAQVERSTAAPFLGIEPASDRPHLFDFPEHRP